MTRFPGAAVVVTLVSRVRRHPHGLATTAGPGHPHPGARHLSGRVAAATFLNTALPYTLAGRTVVGPADREDRAVRTAVLRGRRLDIELGRRVGVVGVLRVIDHAPCFVGTVFVPGWGEVRVEE